MIKTIGKDDRMIGGDKGSKGLDIFLQGDLCCSTFETTRSLLFFPFIT